MKNLLLLAITFLLTTALNLETVSADDWTQFRGAGGLSNVPDANIPIEFDDETNIAWKIELPGKGASGPIVIGDQVIVTSSSGANQDQLSVASIDVKTGKQNWEQKFWATGRCFCHPLSANAAPTPATDGKHIFAFFSSNDLACLDLEGNLIWYRGLAVDFPKAGNDVGMSSSPVVADGVVAVQVECQGDSFAIGLNAENGTTAWKIEREKGAIWSSPLLLAADNSPAMVLLQSRSGFEVFDIKTGKPVFSAKGECSSVSSAAIENGRLYVPLNGTTAYQITGDGKFEEVWNSSQLRPSSMSTVVVDGKLFTLNGTGVLSSFSTEDGSLGKKVRVVAPRSVWATPVVAGDHMYCFTQNGKAHVVKLGEEPEVVHEHSFDEEVFLGSPAIANDALYVRSDKYLWKIANEK